MSAGAFGLHYDYTTPPPLWRGGLQVVNWWGPRKFASRIAEIMDAGGEVIQYTLPVSDGYASAEPEQILFWTGRSSGNYTPHSSPKEWFWDHSNPARVTIPNYSAYVMDMRVGSKWVQHLLNDYYPLIAQSKPGYKCSGTFLDVTGDGYFGQISGLMTSERAEYAAGIRDFVKQLRSVMGEDFIIIGNNQWSGPIDYIDGFAIENHSVGEQNFWAGQLKFVIRTKRRRNVTINRTTSEAISWSNLAGVDAAGCSPNGNYMISTTVNGIVVATLPGHVSNPGGGGNPDPTPVPPPSNGPVGLPGVPTLVSVEATGNSGELLVTWAPRPDNEFVDFYQVYVGDQNNTPSNLEVSKDSTSYTVKGLEDGVAYSIRVGASNAYGSKYGPWSPVMMGTSEVQEPPVDPPPVDDKVTVEEYVTGVQGDFKAIKNRLTGVAKWTRLTEDQRNTVLDAVERAQTGLDRPTPSV